MKTKNDEVDTSNALLGGLLAGFVALTIRHHQRTTITRPRARSIYLFAR
jgi:hypothetical protein